jgi:hypothetical protein
MTSIAATAKIMLPLGCLSVLATEEISREFNKPLLALLDNVDFSLIAIIFPKILCFQFLGQRFFAATRRHM